MSMTSRQFHRAMSSLRPGDVLTNLDCGGCRDRKILVLARAGEGRYDFSVRTDEISIVRDHQGPWRWIEHRLHFENDRGEVHDHIGADVRLLEGAGLTELQWYRELPAPEQTRFHIDPKKALGSFGDSGMTAKLEALLNRSPKGDNIGFARDLQQAVDLIFGGANQAVDERRMRYLVMLAHAVGQKLGRSRKPGIEDLLGSLMGADDLADMPPELAEIFGSGVTVVDGGVLPPGLAEMIMAAGLAGRPRRGSSDRDSQRSGGNGHDRTPQRDRSHG